jgi:DeoR family glycerol-3-phosphate regulon repressor
MEEPEVEEGGATTRRRREILALVEARGFVTIEDLARLFDVSAQTIRRDIIRLDEQGLLQRFHGGAGLPEPHRRPAYRDKQARDVGAKARIAARAAELVPEGACVYLDVGTTAEAVARALAAVPGLTVVTNSLHVAEIVGRGGRAEVRVLGGRLMGPDGSLAGAQTVESLRLLRLDLAIIACSGFDPEGAPMDFDPEKIAVKRTACARARRSLLVADASKFAREATEIVVDAARVDGLVTDADPRGAIAAAFAGRLHLAPPAC